MTAPMRRNAAHSVAVLDRPPWASWRGSEVGRRVRFIGRYCRVPRGVNAGKRIKLLPFQVDYIEATYAEGILSSGLQLPRGNGKSGMLAAMALAELYLNRWSPDVGIAGVTLAQSARPSGVYGLARRMVRLEPELRDRTQVYTNNADPHMTVPDNDGVMAPLSVKDPDAALGLSSSLLIADEFGAAFWDDTRWGNLVQSGGKRGTSSRVLGISTPNSKASAMFTLRARVRKGIASPSVHWAEFAAPEGADVNDRRAWAIGNPALGHFLHESALEADLSDRPLWMFKMMRLGWWQDADESSWLGGNGPGHWDATAVPDLVLSSTEPSYIGVDKSAYDDCSAVAIIQRHGERWRCKVRIFQPVGNVIDHAAVKAEIRRLCAEHRVIAVGYDDRYMVEGAAELEGEGYPMQKVPQTAQRMVPAYSALHRDIVSRALEHDDDPILRTHVLGAVPAIQPSGGFMLAKSRSRTKIDGVVALGIARSLTDTEIEQPLDDDQLKVW